MLTRSLIFERVWGYDFGAGSNSLDVYIGYLRRKTEAGGRAAPDPDGARRRLRAARAPVSFRARLAVAAPPPSRLASCSRCRLAYFDRPQAELRGEVDDALRDRGATIAADVPLRAARALDGPRPLLATARPARRRAGGFVQFVDAEGHVGDAGRRGGRRPLDAAAASRAIARREARRRRVLHRRDVAGMHVRMLTVPIGDARDALQVARPLDEVDATLAPDPQRSCSLVALAGIGARRGARPRSSRARRSRRSGG